MTMVLCLRYHSPMQQPFELKPPSAEPAALPLDPVLAGASVRRCTADGLIELETRDTTSGSGQASFVWVHISHPDAKVISAVAERFSIHPLAAEDMLNSRQRSKVESYSDSVFVVLRSLAGSSDGLQRAEAQILLGPSYIVTLAHGPAFDVDEVMTRSRRLVGEYAPWKILYAVMDLIVDHLQPVAVAIENGFETIEDELFEQSFRRERIEELYHIKRESLWLLATATPVDDLCGFFIAGHVAAVPRSAYPLFRDIADHSKRLVEETHGLKEMVDAALNVNLALVTVGQNEIVKRLAGWGAVLAVPTMVFSLYGMNFVDMPELKYRYGYPITLSVVVVISVVLYARLKKVAWL
jgi:magnesium transporter